MAGGTDREASGPTEAAIEGAAGPRPRGTDRRRRTRFHVPERRTGFDRRRRYPVTGTLRESPVLLAGVLVTVNLLSALDFAFTYLQLRAGVATEGNPILAALFEAGPGRVWLFKTLVMLGVSVVIWRNRRHRSMLAVAVAALLIYVAVIAYHVWGMRVSGLL